jgi:adenylate cyclase
VSRSSSADAAHDKTRARLDSGWARALRWAPVALVAALLLGHAGGGWELASVRQLDAWIHDARLRLFAERKADDRIVVVAIDEASLSALGRWPWSRARLAELVEHLFRRDGIALLGLDLILAEADQSSGLAALEAMANGPLRGNADFLAALASRRDELDHDGRLAAALTFHPVLLGFHLSQGPGATTTGSLPPGVMSAQGFESSLVDFDGHGGNLPRLQAAAAGGGFLNAFVDADGVRRRAPLLARHGQEVHASLALAMARAALGNAALAVQRSTGPALGGLDTLRLVTPERTIAVSMGSNAEVLLPYPDRSALAPTFSAIDVLAGKVPKDALRGRLVLIGATAPGMADLHPSPVAGNLPGVYAHAALLSALLQQRVPFAPPWSPGLHGALLLATLLGGVALTRLELRWATGVAIALAALLFAGNLFAWARLHLGLPLAGPLLLLAVIFSWHVFLGFFLESRGRRRLASLFGQYVPPELVERMARDPERYGMQGRNAELTVMFADVRGFTALSETMPPAELAALINDFLSEMTDIVRAHGGTLDKYVGDAVMAFWGAPVADDAHARHALDAALAMQARLPALNQRFDARGWPAMSLGIGINSGSMVVGDLGSRHRRAYTVLGDAVNVAARLQELSSTYRAGIVLGHGTFLALGAGLCEELDTVVLRGRRTPETIFVPRKPSAGVQSQHDCANP